MTRRRPRPVLLPPVLLIAFAALVAVPLPAQRATHTPDLLLVNGKVFTSDSLHPWAEAVAIRGGRIIAVGTTTRIRSLRGRRTRVIDAGGRVITPGFNDAHDHISGGSPGVEFTTGGPMTNSAPSVFLDSIRAVAARTPAGTWIRGDLWVRSLNDTALRRPALDAVAPRHPVMLLMPTGHGVLVNTAALRALGISDSARDPSGGRYERDGTGRLSGRLDEYAGWLAIRRMRGLLPDSLMAANLRAYAARELRLGVTSVQDMTSNMDLVTARRVFGRARLPIRVRLIEFPIEGDPAPATPAVARKWILDGTPIEGLALMRRPYDGHPNWYGALDFPVDTIRAILARALRTRQPLALHIVGDSTAALVLSVMESLAPDSAWRPLRVRFEHGGVTPDMWARTAAKGVVLVYNLQLLPPPVVSRGLPPQPPPAPPTPVALGSDGEPRSPFVGLYYAAAFPFNPPISREGLVRAYTRGSAYAEFAEGEKGTLAPGQLADLAVLSQDPFTAAVEELPKIESVLTLVGGKVAWDAGLLR